MRAICKNENFERRLKRHRHIRKTVIGTVERPRLNVFRSHQHIYCQIIDDTAQDKNNARSGKTLVACSTLSPTIRKELKTGGDIKAAQIIGKEIAKLALEKGITKVAFDRGGYQYHGRIKALADSARQSGLQF
jgi:large subunit ribosomal protein L18